jgi:peptide/nickel transport system permease protein
MEEEREQEIIKGRSYIKRFLKRFSRNYLGIFGAAIVSLLVFMSLTAPIIFPYPNPRLEMRYTPPFKDWSVPLGTDNLGRDMLALIFYGARTSLKVGLGSILLIFIFGVTIGSLAGYFGKWLDEILMRFTDIMLTIPTLFLIIVFLSMFEVRGINVIIFAIGVTGWPGLARITRSQFLSLKKTPYVEAVQVMGGSSFRIMFKHILPNALPPIIVVLTFQMAGAILMEAGLSFLGLGDPTLISWGKIVTQGRVSVATAWWESTFPGMAILFAVLGFNLLGDAIRDSFEVEKVG